nr:hypothetical protein [Natronorubrum halalkaliphilum]
MTDNDRSEGDLVEVREDGVADENEADFDFGPVDSDDGTEYVVEIVGADELYKTTITAGDTDPNEFDDVEIANVEFGELDQRVGDIQFVVATAPGSNPIDLEQTTVQFIGEQGEDTVAIAGDNIANIQGVTDGVLTDSTDRAEVSFAVVSEIEGYAELNEDERTSVVFTTNSGATTTTELRVPTTITQDSQSVRL